MSFVRLDNGDFPPLNKQNQEIKVNLMRNGNNSCSNSKSNMSKNKSSFDIPTRSHARDNNKGEVIRNSADFVCCRTGLVIDEYNDDLEHVLLVNYIGLRGDFILTPIEPVRSQLDEKLLEVLPDPALPLELWISRVALQLRYPIVDQFSTKAEKHFDNILNYALHLSVNVIVVDLPNSDEAQVSIASILHNRLRETKTTKAILFKVPLVDYNSDTDNEGNKNPKPFDVNLISSPSKSKTASSSELSSSSSQEQSPVKNKLETTSVNNWTCESGFETGSNSQRSGDKSTSCSWHRWNSFRNSLPKYPKIALCLIIDDDFPDDDEELSRWTGETIRMIIIHTNQFTRSPGPKNSLQLNLRCKNFVKRIAISNSLKTSFVIQGRPDEDVTEFMQYLDYMAHDLIEKNNDYLLPWNDRIQPPLQPLSTNLDASTYGVFEMDTMKYTKYQEAMVLALKDLISKEQNTSRQFILMVLGAGRGPLVDSFIKAIKAVGIKYKFKIYALDKNPHSVVALKYKQKKLWVDSTGLYETEVVEADMRCWEPGVKADIIVSELLGSLADNELSPECIDGTWRFTKPETISIPQSYESYLGPICSSKLHQEVNRLVGLEECPFDQVYVVRLSNYYRISYPDKLFSFEHKNLSLDPSQRCNERYRRLFFWSKIDTVCHGFAGYFKAKLYGNITISTLLDKKTPNMDSWFPAFIPLEEPIQMPKDSKLELCFWRKENISSVWYEWVVKSPSLSRIHSQYGLKAAMSKFI